MRTQNLIIPFIWQENLMTSEIFKNAVWQNGPDLIQDQRTGCTVNIPNEDLSVVIKNNASIYDWNTESWARVNNRLV